ncbi:MAG: histidine kinase [Alphaproteobacteria bacterium]|nr:histidine kinase [Alphaproteobacteria bacterium]
MTKLLVSESNPEGYTTESVLSVIRADIVKRMGRYAGDPRKEARQILDNNVRILGLLGEAIGLAETNTRILSD